MPIHAHAICSGCFSACLPSPTGRCRACRGLPALEKGEPLEISPPAAPTQPASPQRPSAVSALPDPRIRRYAKGENVLTPRPGSLPPPVPPPPVPPPPVPRPKPIAVAVEESKKLCGFCSKELPPRVPGAAGRPPVYCDRACKLASRARHGRERRGAVLSAPASVVVLPEDPEARRDLLARFAGALEVRARREAEKQAVLELVSLHGVTHYGKWRVRGARVGSWIDLETRDPILALERARVRGAAEEVVETHHGGLYDRGGEGIWYVDTHVDGRRVHRSLRTRDRAEAERRVGEIRDKLGREALERAGVLDPPLPKVEGGARFYLVRWKHQNRRGEHVESPFWYARLLAGERTKTVTTRCEDREAAAIVAARLLSKFAADEPCTIGRLPNGSGKKEPGTTVKIGQGLIDDLAIALPGVPLGVAVRRLLIEALSFREVYGDPIRESVSSSGGQA